MRLWSAAALAAALALACGNATPAPRPAERNQPSQRVLDWLDAAERAQKAGLLGTARELYLKAITELSETLGQDHPELAAALEKLADLESDDAQYETAEVLYERASAIRKLHAADQLDEYVTVERRVSDMLFERGRYADALERLDSLLAFQENRVAKDSDQLVKTLRMIGGCHRRLANTADAQSVVERALAIRVAHHGEIDAQVAAAHNELGLVYWAAGRYEEAETQLKQTLEIDEALGDDKTDRMGHVHNLALLYSDWGRHGEAIPMYEEVLAADEKRYGPEHPTTANTLHNLAGAYRGRQNDGDVEKAIELFRRALDIKERTLGPEHPLVVPTIYGLAGAYMDAGEVERAESLYIKAIELANRVLGKTHPDGARARNELAEIRLTQGREDEALPLLKSALASLVAAYGDDHPELFWVHQRLSRAYLALGQLELAEKHAQRHLEMVDGALVTIREQYRRDALKLLDRIRRAKQ